MSELVTGEAVVLDVRLARPATRALAFGLDLLLEVVAVLALTIPLGYVAADAGAGDALIAGLTVLVIVVIFVGYTTAIETLTRGKSVGKYAMGLRVLRDDGGPVRFRHALVRALTGVFADFMTTFGCGAFLTAMLNSRGKRIGDVLAGTIVVRERAPRATEELPEIPPALVGWATHAELSRVPDDLAMSARSFLARFHELSPSSREALGDRLAGALGRYVSPPAPPGTPDWAFLTAVLSERRRRALEQQAPTPPGQQPVQPPAQPGPGHSAPGPSVPPPGVAGPPPAPQDSPPDQAPPGGGFAPPR